MAQLSIGGPKPRRAVLLVAYVVLLSLAALAVLDIGSLFMPGSIPASSSGSSGSDRPDVVDPRSPAAGIVRRWMDIFGRDGLKIILELVIPGLRPAVPVQGPGGMVWQGRQGPDLFGYALRTFTSITPGDPGSLLAAQITGLRTVAMAARGTVEITPDAPGEGESWTPPASGEGWQGDASSGGNSTSGIPEMPAGGGSETGAGGLGIIDWGPATAPVVAVYHSHAMESYLPCVKMVGAGTTGKMDAEEAFSDDPEITVVRAGQELAEVLAKQFGIPTIHSRRFHDSGGRLGAYVQSAETVERLLNQYPSLRVLIDVHRDAPRRERTTAVVNGQSVARILLLVGSDVKLAHPNWESNYGFALALHQAMENLYPGLSLGIMVKESRYNQHYLPHAMLVEMGGVDNSMEEVLRSTRMFATALVAVMRADPTLVIPRTGGDLR